MVFKVYIIFALPGFLDTRISTCFSDVSQPILAEQWKVCEEEQRLPPGEHTWLTDYILHPCRYMNAYSCVRFYVNILL